MHDPLDCDEEERRIAPLYLAAGDPTGWFEELYAGGETGRITMPFNRAAAHPLLVEWAERRNLDGTGQRAIVVGCGLGADAEYIADHGFTTIGFDISQAAVRLARRRHPTSQVEYVRADLLEPPAQWRRAFDLVVEIITVQALPDPPRGQAIINISRLVGAGGTLLVVADAHDDERLIEPPPWPLRRDEIEAFAADTLTTVHVERTAAPTGRHRWRAELHREPSGHRSGAR